MLSRGRKNIVRVGAIFVFGMLLLWLVLSLTVANVFSFDRPDISLKWWPWSSSAGAKEAAQQLEGVPSTSAIHTARHLALMALSREPGNAMAARDLGLTYALQGNIVRAERLFHYSEEMSRRDYPTQLWLIETNVQRGNIAAALQHYDRAMRSSLAARETLIPILVGAVQTPNVATAVAKLIAVRPNWASDFIAALISQSHGADALATIIPAARLDPTVPAQRDQLATALRHMVDLGSIGPAYNLYLTSRGRSLASRAILRDGGFDGASGLFPFEWQLMTGEGHEAVREKVSGAHGQALLLYGNAGGEMARQLLLLHPGTYRLSGLAGSIPSEVGARPSISFVCATGSHVVMANLAIPSSDGAPQKFVHQLTVPSGCGAEWLFVSSGSIIDQAPEAPWIDELDLTQVLSPAA